MAETDASMTSDDEDMPTAATMETDPDTGVVTIKRKLIRDAVTGQQLKRRDAVNIENMRPALVDFIRQDHPDIPHRGFLSRKLIEKYRSRFISELLREERGELSVLENEVIESLESHDTLTENIEDDYEEKRSLGDRVADGVASFGGSWTFIISFCAFLAVWMMMNLVLGANEAFDAYPFILLNLVLSTIAALQAPVIMMSQRRQEQKDRLRALNDYKVNLKAELEIRHLHEKVDHLLNRQWERLTEIQQIQIEMMRDQAKKTERALKAVKSAKPPQKKTKAPAAAPEPSDGSQ